MRRHGTEVHSSNLSAISILGLLDLELDRIEDVEGLFWQALNGRPLVKNLYDIRWQYSKE